MNNPIPLDLAKRVRAAYVDAPLDTTADEDMQAALAAHLHELAACHYREVDESVIERVLRSEVDAGHATPDDLIANAAYSIAAALSDATNGGHWEEGEEAYTRAVNAGLPRRSEFRGRANPDVTSYGWVPADPDARLLAIVDADTLARLREVAEVTAR